MDRKGHYKMLTDKHDLLYWKPWWDSNQKILFKVTHNFVSNYAFEHFANYVFQAIGSVISKHISVAFLKDWCDIRWLPIEWIKPCRDLLNRDARVLTI